MPTVCRRLLVLLIVLVLAPFGNAQLRELGTERRDRLKRESTTHTSDVSFVFRSRNCQVTMNEDSAITPRPLSARISAVLRGGTFRFTSPGLNCCCPWNLCAMGISRERLIEEMPPTQAKGVTRVGRQRA